ncbi:hypothetical protein PIB30_064327 [Stylosanthes scabra]|uniref:RNase H type-1 domain-containing protein n=1 Tax=Stylosanthes scabra TaxID=79078 RepID=A0ABU6VNE5_9FABA|nr:hypothetical protein [Stylosanthes scabra]
MVNASAIEAEIRAILQGLEIAWEKGHKLLVVETESKGAMDLIMNPPLRHHILSRHLKRIRSIVNRNWTVKFNHQLREANKVADKLSNFALDTQKRALISTLTPVYFSNFIPPSNPLSCLPKPTDANSQNQKQRHQIPPAICSMAPTTTTSYSRRNLDSVLKSSIRSSNASCVVPPDRNSGPKLASSSLPATNPRIDLDVMSSEDA